MWILQATDPDSADALKFRVMPGVTKTLGRATRADFVVNAAMVSRFHCRLSASQAGTLEVQDLNSTNGTFVNERRVTHAVLSPGDRLRVGRLELVVRRSR